MRSLDINKIRGNVKRINSWGKIEVGADRKPRNLNSRRVLVITDSVKIYKKVDPSKFVRVTTGEPIGRVRGERTK